MIKEKLKEGETDGKTDVWCQLLHIKLCMLSIYIGFCAKASSSLVLMLLFLDHGYTHSDDI